MTRGALWSSLGWFLGFGAGITTSLVLVRVMSHQAFGSMTTASAMLTLMSALGDFGIRSAIVQFSSALSADNQQDERWRALSSGRYIAWSATGVLGIACAGIAVWFGESSHLRSALLPMCVLFPAILVTPFSSVYTGLSQANFHVKRVTTSRLVQAGVQLTLSLLLVVVGAKSATEQCGSLGASVIAAFIVLVWRGTSLVGQKVSISGRVRDDVKRLRRLSASMLLNTAAWAAISQFDVIVVTVERGTHLTAFYGPISNLANTIVGLPPVIGTYLLSGLAREAKLGRTDRVGSLYRGVSRWSIWACAAPISVALVAPRSTLSLLFGTSYAPYGGTLRIAMIGVVITVILGFNGQALDAFGLPKMVAIRSLAGIIVNVIACPILVMAFGASGAALSTALSISVINVYCSATLYRKFHIGPSDRYLALLVGVGVIIAGMIRLFVSDSLGIIGLCLVGAAVGASMGIAMYVIRSLENASDTSNG